MKKIAFIISNLENSGPVNIMFNIIKYLDRKIFRVYIYTLSDEKSRTRIKEFKDMNCYVEKLEISNKDIYLGNLNKVQNILERDQIDIIHSHCLRSNLIISKLKNNIKKICTIHANIEQDYRFKFGNLKGSILKYVYLNTLKNIDYKICCSKSVLIAMKKQTKEKLNYITNGVDLEKFSVKQTKEESRKRLKISNEDKVFISVGSLCERKDALFIAKRIKNLGLKRYKLIFLGEGIQANKIEELNNPNILLLGKVSNVKEYLNASDYYISAANSEGMPNSVLEALALKLPIILSDIDSHQEILKMNLNAGVCFNKEQRLDFEEKIKDILDKEKYFLSEQAYQIVSENLNAKKMSEKYGEEYICITQN